MAVTITGPSNPYNFGSLGIGMYGDWMYEWHVQNTGSTAVTINCTITGTNANNFQFDNLTQSKSYEVGNGTISIPLRFAPLSPAGSKTATLTISCPVPDCNPSQQSIWTLQGTATSGSSYYLQITNSPGGGGYVIIKDANQQEINSCYENQCTYGPYPNGTVFNLYAYPNTGYEFSTYSGGYCGSNYWCNCIIDNANLVITAFFTEIQQGSIGTIDNPNCTWYHGPWVRGQNAFLARPHIGNNGYTTDTVYRRYLYKGTDNLWHEICQKQAAIGVGQFVYYDDYCTIPASIQTCSIGSQCVNFCLKVWGTGESEPSDPSLAWAVLTDDMVKQPMLAIDSASILIGAALATGLVWWMYAEKSGVKKELQKLFK